MYIPTYTASLAASIGALLLRAVSALLESFYNRFVVRARPGSLPTVVWRALVSTVLKAQMWSYFDTNTDFGRQLSGFTPNAKFESGEFESRGSESRGGGRGGGGGHGGGDLEAGGTGYRVQGGGDLEAGAAAAGGGGRSLRSLVDAVKATGVRHVYCWHALHGYWRGVSPALGEAESLPIVSVVAQPSSHLLQMEPQIAWDTPALFGAGNVTSAAHTDMHTHAHT